jgi:hypothetical protein
MTDNKRIEELETAIIIDTTTRAFLHDQIRQLDARVKQLEAELAYKALEGQDETNSNVIQQNHNARNEER